jgi:3-isopropylmalate dehydrogenase
MINIAIFPGDGIGPEVTDVAFSLLDIFVHGKKLPIKYHWYNYCADKYLQEGITLDKDTIAIIKKTCDAVFLGAIGDPRIQSHEYAKNIILGLRFGLDVYANVRPVKLLNTRLCPLKDAKSHNIDLTVIRENTEGPYCQIGGILDQNIDNSLGIQVSVHTKIGVRRLIEFSFKYARDNNYKNITLCSKHNALPFGYSIWVNEFESVSKDYKMINKDILFADSLCAALIRKPDAFGVIIADSLFGDLLSDLAAELQGGLGMAPSACYGDQNIILVEPVHGSAPDIAGKGLANPIASCLSLCMLLEHFNYFIEANIIRDAISQLVGKNILTPDVGGKSTTADMKKELIEIVYTLLNERK